MRYLYSSILYLMLPWVLLRLWLKGARVPGYRKNLKERFGFGAANPDAGLIWVHAVSVGEVRAAQALVQTLLQDRPEQVVLITTVTPGGRETVQQLFGESVVYRYLPYDLPGSVRRFVNAARPAVAIVMETEIWPNLFFELARRKIPLLLLNARLSPRSLRGYLKWRSLSGPALQSVDRIAAQSEEDAQRFVRLGAGERQLTVTGNLKLDGQLPPDFEVRSQVLRKLLVSGRRVWLAGSTHEGEEQQLLEAHRLILETYPDALLLIAPRHPERATELAGVCRRAGLGFRLYTEASSASGDEQVTIIDTLGELVYLYGVTSVAFIGGSLVDRGGHNPVEPALAAVAVATGPFVGNFAGIYAKLSRAGAVREIRTAAALAELVCDWFADDKGRQAAGSAALRVVEQNRGALQRGLRLVNQVLA